MDIATLTTTLTAAQAFVDWINDEADIPESHHFSLDTPGPKRVRIVMHTPNQRFVHAFVDLATGDLLKAAGWKAPAAGARGNIITDLEEVQAEFDWAGRYLYAR
jgi:hypothetical protein